MRPNNQNQNKNRGRNRGNNNRRGGGNSHRSTYDSNGPNVRIRGSASQIHDKYITLARDASSSGDPVLAESYLQFAEHYYRIANPENENRPPRRHEQSGDQAGEQTGEQDGDSAESQDQEASGGRGRGRGRMNGRRRHEQSDDAAQTVETDAEDAGDEGEAVVETLGAAPASDSDDDENASSQRGAAKVKTFEQGDLLNEESKEEAKDPPKAPARRRRTPRAKAPPQSPAELAAAVSGED